jgi:T5orf172 domain
MQLRHVRCLGRCDYPRAGGRGASEVGMQSGQGSVPPLEDAVRAEIVAVIEADETGLGDVWRRTRDGQTPDEIREARGAQKPNFVWNYSRTARAIVDGDLPAASTVALTASRTLRRLLKENVFSPATRQVLEERLTELERLAADPSVRAVEDKQARDATARAEENAVPGIYVYTLPHYLRHPYDEKSERTLMKVGRADRSVIRRFREQTRTTALPEDPVLLRVYPTSEEQSIDKERVFHRLLEAADHDRSQARTGGTEWFLTSTKFLDEIASAFGMEIREVTDLADVLSQ